MGNYVGHETEESTKKLLVAWYKESATGWQPSDRTVAVVAEILEASGNFFNKVLSILYYYLIKWLGLLSFLTINSISREPILAAC